MRTMALVQFAALMAAMESTGGGGSPAADPSVVQTPETAKAAAAAADAAAAANASPDPVSASIATAREWIDSGQATEERAAEWLHANCPGAFKNVKAAAAAISQ